MLRLMPAPRTLRPGAPSRWSRASVGFAALAFTAWGVAAAAQSLAHPALASLPEGVRAALHRGQVVTLESEVAGTSYTTRVAALVAGDPAKVVSEIRDYGQLPRIYPEMRSLSYDRGPDHDRFRFSMKLHPLLPAITFAKSVTWDVQPNGDANVDIALERSTQRRVEAQDWAFHAFRVDDAKTLLVYETKDRYHGVPGKNKLLARLADISTRLVADIKTRSLGHLTGERAGQ